MQGLVEPPPLLVFKWLLATLNAALLVLLVGLMLGHLQRQHKIKSWSLGFHVLCFAWLCFRQAFWVLSIVRKRPWSTSTFYLVYWLPHPIQFAMYLLVPLFYFKVPAQRPFWV